MCLRNYVFLSDESLLNVTILKRNLCINNVLTYLHMHVQYSHSAWFLDGRTSIVVFKYFRVA